MSTAYWRNRDQGITEAASEVKEVNRAAQSPRLSIWWLVSAAKHSQLLSLPVSVLEPLPKLSRCAVRKVGGAHDSQCSGEFMAPTPQDMILEPPSPVISCEAAAVFRWKSLHSLRTKNFSKNEFPEDLQWRMVDRAAECCVVSLTTSPINATQSCNAGLYALRRFRKAKLATSDRFNCVGIGRK